MSHITKEDILTALSTVHIAQTGQDIVSAGLVSSVVLRDGRIGFALEVGALDSGNHERLRQECEQAVRNVANDYKVTAVLTAEKPSSPAPELRSAPAQITPVPGVRHIIAVAAGKGGVGKSTVTVALAYALKQAGYRVGVVDADIYGPSIPMMLGVSGKPEIDAHNRMIPKMNAAGIESISMGYLLEDHQAAIWRGPMATKALGQLFRGTAWKDKDFLIVDLPPGTGDVHLSLTKNVPLSGAILVSTPQQVALADVRKAVDMLRKTDVPILGIIENMSYFIDPVSGNRNYVFGEQGVKPFAAEQGIPFLGEIPLDPKIGQGLDRGQPIDNLTNVFATVLKQLTTLV